jgi:hypothetical protein
MDQKSSIVVLIDGENLAYWYAPRILARAEEVGTITFVGLYGYWDAMRAWSWAISTYLLEERGNGTWKNAADENMKHEVWSFHRQCNVTNFLLATNDGHFATMATTLRCLGCTIHGAGTYLAANRLVQACTTYTWL